jgi:hypothetical protein
MGVKRTIGRKNIGETEILEPWELEKSFNMGNGQIIVKSMLEHSRFTWGKKNLLISMPYAMNSAAGYHGLRARQGF